MINFIDLALKFGGFTSLDKIYLTNQLTSLTDEEKLSFITPPPSVINAYFAELYQKKGPKAATDYYFDISKALQMFQTKPSFDEHKPFVRLNLSGKSYGFAYENDDEVAQVFPEKEAKITFKLLCEIAQIFPNYNVFEQKGIIKMKPLIFDDQVIEELTPESSLLSQIFRLKGNIIKIQSFNEDELIELIGSFKGTVYFGFKQREYLAYIIPENK